MLPELKCSKIVDKFFFGILDKVLSHRILLMWNELFHKIGLRPKNIEALPWLLCHGFGVFYLSCYIDVSVLAKKITFWPDRQPLIEVLNFRWRLVRGSKDNPIARMQKNIEENRIHFYNSDNPSWPTGAYITPSFIPPYSHRPLPRQDSHILPLLPSKVSYHLIQRILVTKYAL